jgi:hypothetical protein
MVAVAEPFAEPKQLTFVTDEILAVGPPLFVTVTVPVMTQPFASVMVQV